MEERKSLRKFSEPSGVLRRRDVDAVDRSMLLWSFVAGALGVLLGGFLGVFIRIKGGPVWAAVLSPLVGAAAMVGLVRIVVGGGVTAAGTIYSPSGSTTPHKREHSQAESLVARGMYEEAVTAFELAVAEDPTDPWPYLRVARIYRDHLGRLEDAARWFRRAFREAHAAPSIARKELVELYVHRLKQPAKAAPELARMAEELAGTPEGSWAATELRHVKELMTLDADEA